MRFTLTDDQRAFVAAFAEMLEKECTPERLRAGDLTLWPALDGIGVLDVGFTDLVLLAEQAGRFALPDPLVEHAAVALPFAGARALVTTSFDDAPYAPDADRADAVLVQRADGLFLVAPAGLVRQRSVDPTRRLFSVSAEDGEQVGSAEDAARAAERGAVGTAAVCLGVADRLITMAADYAMEREQFGKAIGEFQLVKGALADALVKLTYARPVVYRAGHSVEHSSEDLARDAALAKAFASEAVSLAARTALQVHGAIGYTEEHDLHIWLKRAFALANAWGSAAVSWERVGRAVLRAR